MIYNVGFFNRENLVEVIYVEWLFGGVFLRIRSVLTLVLFYTYKKELDKNERKCNLGPGEG